MKKTDGNAAMRRKQNPLRIKSAGNPIKPKGGLVRPQALTDNFVWTHRGKE